MLHTLFIRESLETMGVTTPTHGFWRASRMRVHRNAKTTPHMRRLIHQRVTRGWTQRTVGRGPRHQCPDGGQVGRPGSWHRAAHRRVVASAPAAAPAGGYHHRGDCRLAAHAGDGVADQCGLGRAALHGHSRAAPRGSQSDRHARARAGRAALRVAACRRLLHLDINAWAGSAVGAPHSRRPAHPRARYRLGVHPRRHR